MDVFMGMIAMFGFNYPPRGWMSCSGQLISISQNSALFALLGTTFGGNGTTTFGLPDLRGRIPIGGTIQGGGGPGLSNYVLGQTGGTENVTLSSNEMPQHTHLMTASGDEPTQPTAQGASLGSQGRSGATPVIYANGATTPVNMASATAQTGGNQPHNNLQPYLAISYCIAVTGIFPSRN